MLNPTPSPTPSPSTTPEDTVNKRDRTKSLHLAKKRRNALELNPNDILKSFQDEQLDSPSPLAKSAFDITPLMKIENDIPTMTSPSASPSNPLDLKDTNTLQEPLQFESITNENEHNIEKAAIKEDETENKNVIDFEENTHTSVPKLVETNIPINVPECEEKIPSIPEPIIEEKRSSSPRLRVELAQAKEKIFYLEEELESFKTKTEAYSSTISSLTTDLNNALAQVPQLSCLMRQQEEQRLLQQAAAEQTISIQAKQINTLEDEKALLQQSLKDQEANFIQQIKELKEEHASLLETLETKYQQILKKLAEAEEKNAESFNLLNQERIARISAENALSKSSIQTSPSPSLSPSPSPSSPSPSPSLTSSLPTPPEILTQTPPPVHTPGSPGPVLKTSSNQLINKPDPPTRRSVALGGGTPPQQTSGAPLSLPTKISGPPPPRRKGSEDLLLSALNKSVAALLFEFERANHHPSSTVTPSSSPSRPDELEKSEKSLSEEASQRIESVVRNQLSTALALLFNDSKRPGVGHLWSFLQEASLPRGGATDILGTGLIRSVKSLNLLSPDNNLKFRAFVCTALNKGVLHQWLDRILSNELVVHKYYEDEALIQHPSFLPHVFSSLQVLALPHLSFLLSVGLTEEVFPLAQKTVELCCSKIEDRNERPGPKVWFRCESHGSNHTVICVRCIVSCHQAHTVKLIGVSSESSQNQKMCSCLQPPSEMAD